MYSYIVIYLIYMIKNQYKNKLYKQAYIDKKSYEMQQAGQQKNVVLFLIHKGKGVNIKIPGRALLTGFLRLFRRIHCNHFKILFFYSKQIN